MSKRIEWNETPDIEVQADEWEEQQEVLRQLAEEEARQEAAMAACDAISDMASDCPLAEVDSCLALQMIDGLVPIPEAWLIDDLDREEQRIIDRAKAAGVPL